jgi:hypothetical protein
VKHLSITSEGIAEKKMTGENDSCGKASNMSPKKTANNGKRKIHILY